MATGGKTFYQIQIEQMELDGSIKRRKPGSEVPMLPHGQVPRVANVWNDVDRDPVPPAGPGKGLIGTRVGEDA
jgi:hypothetical protein